MPRSVHAAHDPQATLLATRPLLAALSPPGCTIPGAFAPCKALAFTLCPNKEAQQGGAGCSGHDASHQRRAQAHSDQPGPSAQPGRAHHGSSQRQEGPWGLRKKNRKYSMESHWKHMNYHVHTR